MFADSLKKRMNPDDLVWKCNPPTIENFLESTEYMGGPEFSVIQLEDAIALLGENPKEIFSGGSNFTIAVLLWGKGSGKDWFAARIQSYLLEVLCCMKNPQGYFKLAPNEPIDLLNVSLSQVHAITIYFVKLRNAILSNKKMLDRYSVYDGNQLIKMTGNVAGKPKLEFRSGEICFTDRNIRARAFGCDNEAAEGGNPLFWSMDEASAFKDHTRLSNAKKIYSTLRTSSASRFGGKWKGMVISYPRSEDDFTVKLFNESKRSDKTENGDTIYGSKYSTWEVRPKGTYSIETFEFEGMNIPTDFKDEFDKYPEDSMAKFVCRPPAVESAFISYRHRIDECVIRNKTPLFTVDSNEIELITDDSHSESKHYVGKVITGISDKSREAMQIHRVIHVDGGLINDCAVMIVAHGVPHEIMMKDRHTGKISVNSVNKVVVDAVVVWRPDKKKGLQVSLNSIETLILELRKTFNIKRVSYDQWNSQSSLETLQSQRISAEKHTITTDDYRQLRTMIYSRAVELLPGKYMIGDLEYKNPDALLLVEELMRLMTINGKVNHPRDFSKDAADCLAGVNRLLNDPDEKRLVVSGFPKGVVSHVVMNTQLSPISPTAMGLDVGLFSKNGKKGLTSLNDLQAYRDQHASQASRNLNWNVIVRQGSIFPRGVMSSGNNSGMPGRQVKGVPEYLLR